MIAAVAALATVTVMVAGALLGLVINHNIERRGWAEERRALVDRAIARHTGEIVAMDRTHEHRDRTNAAAERPVAVGL